MEAYSKLDRRIIIAYWVCAGVIILIATATAVVFTAREYHTRLTAASQSGLILARALAEHTTQIFDKLDALGLAVTEDLEMYGGKDISELLRRRSAAEPAARAIAVVDDTGRITASSVGTLSVGTDLSGSKAFAQHASVEATNEFISSPYANETGNGRAGWTIDYSRRIAGHNNEFNGYILIVVDEGFLYGFYDQLAPVGDEAIGLVGEDGVIRASNSPDEIGKPIDEGFQAEIRTGGGTKIGESSLSDERYLYVFSRSNAAPLLAYVGRPFHEILHGWLRFAIAVLVALLVVYVALALVGILLGKYVRGRGNLIKTTIDAAKMRQEHEFLSAILDTGGALVMVADPKGFPVMANPAFRSLFDTTESFPDESLLERVTDNSLAEIVDGLPIQKIAIIRDQTNRKRELAWTVTAIKGDNGSIRNFVAIGFDNTDRRETELAIYQAGKLITLGEMATGLAHEMNQPLGTIGLTVDVLRSRLKARTATRDFLESKLSTIRNQVDRTAAIIDHMRVFGRRSERAIDAIDPVAAMEGALTIAEAQISKYDILVRRNYVPGTYQVAADRIMLEQILINLLLNARDAIVERRKTETQSATTISDCISLSIRASTKDGIVSICVADTGTGIDAAIVDQIFNPFFTTKPVGFGTGLGLSLSYGMAKDLGGWIDARNIDQGAEFSVYLPQTSAQGGSNVGEPVTATA